MEVINPKDNKLSSQQNNGLLIFVGHFELINKICNILSQTKPDDKCEYIPFLIGKPILKTFYDKKKDSMEINLENYMATANCYLLYEFSDSKEELYTIIQKTGDDTNIEINFILFRNLSVCHEQIIYEWVQKYIPFLHEKIKLKLLTTFNGDDKNINVYVNYL